MLNDILMVVGCLAGTAIVVLGVCLYVLVRYLGDFDDPNW